MDQFSNLVDIDITDVILHIGAFEEFALVFLLFLQGQQLFAKSGISGRVRRLDLFLVLSFA